MKSREFTARRLDVAQFAEQGASLQGSFPLEQLTRCAELLHSERGRLAVASWNATGELRRQRTGAAQIWLHLEADTTLTLTCQRCLGPVEIPIHVDRLFRFVATEEEAAALDEADDHDVLAVSRTLDLQELIEDEILLDAPIVPHHVQCPRPLPMSSESDDGHAPTPEVQAADTPTTHPFAALARLRGSAPSDDDSD